MSSLQGLQALIQEKYGLDPSQLDPNASMRSSGVDSLGLVEFLFAVEDHYGISLPDDYSNIDTLSDLSKLVDQRLAERATQTA